MTSTTLSSTTRARPVVVYDGACPFCLRQIQKIKARDTDAMFEYTPRQAEGLEARFPQLAAGDFNSGMRLVHMDGSVSVGADAVYHIARRLRGWGRWAWLYRVPGLRMIFRAGYAWIARNRYKLAQRSQTCPDDACRL